MTRRFAAALFAAACLIPPASAGNTPACPPQPLPVSSARVVFSPEESGQAAVIGMIDAASVRVRVAMFHFSNNHIADALIRAHRRGVDTAVILDKSHLTDKRSVGPRLLAGGVPVFIDAEHKTAHNKVTVTDGRWVVTGSYNYNTNAETRNAENLLILDSPALAARYEENWLSHRAHSSAFTVRPGGSAGAAKQK